MDVIEKAIQTIQEQYKAGIDYSGGKDNAAICLLGEQAEAVIKALHEFRMKNKPLTLDQLPELVGNPVWISGINQYGILGRKGVDADDDGNPIFRYVVGCAFGWEWLDDVLRGDRKIYARKPEQEEK
ncbi:hypothetical protein [Faecalispora sporosphaeroides]|uniref:hypothetical protein n=1 Tax=Faecalispora sporosphaeroides TaxID=1549 RepID=UPI00037DF3FC|nr:hypothetical protein [Faecalispora sporosphaeroides]